MTGGTPKRSSTLDAGFLQTEDSDRHTSPAIGSVAVLEGPPPDVESFASAIDDRVRRLPRCTQLLRSHPFDTRAPHWVHDDAFDVNHHVRRTAAAPPGDDAALHRAVAEVIERRLDRDRPPWECWLVDGLTDGRWALVVKVHHDMVDEIAPSALLSALCDGASVVQYPQPDSDDARRPANLPTGNPLWWLTGAWNASVATARCAWLVSSGVAQIASEILSPRSQVTTGPLTATRRYGSATVSLREVTSIGRRFDVTVDDVALAAITDAFREARPPFPVSVRRPDELRRRDNRISGMPPLLPLDTADPLERLRAVRSLTAPSEASGQSQACGLLASLASNVLPFALPACTVRLLTRQPQREGATVTTNAPGPRTRVTVMGRAVQSLLPIPPVPAHGRIAIAVTSYADELTFGVTGDSDVTMSPDELANRIREGVERLVSVTKACKRSRRSGNQLLLLIS